MDHSQPSPGHPSAHDDRPTAPHTLADASPAMHNVKHNAQVLTTTARDKGRSSVFSMKRDASRRADSPSSRKPQLTKSQSPGPGSRVNGSASPAASPKKMGFPHSPPLTPPPSHHEPRAPIYMSSFHRPSTNPIFDIEVDGKGVVQADLSACQIRVQLWGQSDGGSNKGVDKGKGKGVSQPTEDGHEWKVFCTWDLDLSELIPLPDEVSLSSMSLDVCLQHILLQLETYPSKLPSNTLLVKFVDSRSTFYLPHSLLGATPEDSLPQSPDYNSDTEVTLHSRRPIPSLFIQTRRRTFKKDLTTSSYQDLVK